MLLKARSTIKMLSLPIKRFLVLSKRFYYRQSKQIFQK